MNMDWKSFTDDLLLMQQLTDRFEEIGCDSNKAFELASYVYLNQNSAVVIRAREIKSNDILNNTNKLNYDTNGSKKRSW